MFELPELPYTYDALAPYISTETMTFHHTKHHATYVKNLNNLIQGSSLEGKKLEEIILASNGKTEMQGIFNNAAQVWNHTFFWNSMKADGPRPTGALADQIEKDFGSYASFEEQFKNAAITQFGSGWAWLVWDGQHLSVIKTSNAELPMTKGLVAILTCDVWEHAYYLDYQNRRPDFVDTFLKHLINWDFAAQNFEQARAGA